MDNLKYVKNKLYIDGVSVETVAKKYGTPFYLYSHKNLTDRLEALQKAFKKEDTLICFSVKTNGNLSVIKTLINKGAGCDIVSGGELFRALKAGCPANKIVYAGVGKRSDEIEYAIKKGILLFNIESEPELDQINKIAKKLKKKVNVALRLNPDVDAKTHAYITTGKKENKFGIDFVSALKLFKKKYSNVNIHGIHLHIGSQITTVAPYVKAIKKTLAYIDKNNICIKFFNIGGGIGIVYDNEKVKAVNEYAKEIVPLIKGRGYKLIMEPGRSIAGNSGMLVTKTVYIKENRSGKKFAICDAGMNDLIRPSLYSAYHDIVNVTKMSTKKYKYDIVGPICETGDFFGKGRNLNKLSEGDLIAVKSSGAYGFSMSGNYNARPRCAEIMIVKAKAQVIRDAETFTDLIKGEKIIRGL